MSPTQERINDVVIKIATVNGTGSSSANGMLMKAIFRMGVPVSGKNIFPSNIQGLPTWYEIRVSEKGYLGRNDRVDIMVAMNPQTYRRDVADVEPGGIFVYDSSWPLSEGLHRDDVTYVGVPFAELCAEKFEGSRIRILMKNIAYVGTLAALLDLDLEVIRKMLAEKFAAKEALIESNMDAVGLGYDYARERYADVAGYKVKRSNGSDDHIIIDGNEALALGFVFGGATVGAWYPITPSTSVMDGFNKYCAKFRINPETGEKSYAILQAEDELAAAGIVLGAGWNGARAFTPTSGPGISLMTEFIGFAYFAEIPSVFANVQRVGPSTGMPTRTQQCDLISCAYASHGDTKHILLFPADPKECFEFGPVALDLAELFQTPIFVLSDLDIGMNDWMVPTLKWDDGYEPDRGAVLSEKEIADLRQFYRYDDVDGDGICARTLPGVHPKGSYFTRGSGHNRYGGYTEDGDEYVEVVDRLAKKHAFAKTKVPKPVERKCADATVGVVSIGSCDHAVQEALDYLEADGVKSDYMRIRAFPFTDEVEEFVDRFERVFVVEQNRDAQLRSLLILEAGVSQDKLISILEYGGLPMTARQIVGAIKNRY